MKLFIFGILAGWLVEWLFYLLAWKPGTDKAWAKKGKKRSPVEQQLQEENQQLRVDLNATQYNLSQLKKTKKESDDSEAIKILRHQLEQVKIEKQDLQQQIIALKTNPVKSIEKTDDFTQIAGIGPKVADALVTSGITNFSELMKQTQSSLEERLEALNVRVVNRKIIATWPEQAQKLAKQA